MAEEAKWIHAGLTCMILTHDMGHRCGYVLVPKHHVFHGVDYGDCINPEHKNEKHCYCGDTPESRLSAHGGITFGGGLQDYKGWWFGFDCAHHGDAQDPSIMSPDMKKKAELNPDIYLRTGGHIRSAEYVANECQNLASQLRSMMED